MIHEAKIFKTTLGVVALSIMLGGLSACSDTNTLKESSVSFVEQVNEQNKADWEKVKDYNIKETIEIVGKANKQEEIGNQESVVDVEKLRKEYLDMSTTKREYYILDGGLITEDIYNTLTDKMKVAAAQSVVNENGELMINIGGQFFAKNSGIKYTASKDIANGQYSDVVNAIMDKYEFAPYDKTHKETIGEGVAQIRPAAGEGVRIINVCGVTVFMTDDEARNYLKSVTDGSMAASLRNGATLTFEGRNDNKIVITADNIDITITHIDENGKITTEHLDACVDYTYTRVNSPDEGKTMHFNTPLEFFDTYDTMQEELKTDYEARGVVHSDLYKNAYSLIKDVEIENVRMLEAKEKADETRYIKGLIKQSNSGVAKYCNSLGPDSYEVIGDWVVITQAGRDYMDTLTVKEQTVYAKVELEVFKMNNPTTVHIVNDPTIRSSNTKGAYSIKGFPVWVDRDWDNGFAVTYKGEIRYPMGTKTVPEFRKYCGGTDVAFRGWSQKRYPIDEDRYNGIQRGYRTVDEVRGWLVDVEFEGNCDY